VVRSATSPDEAATVSGKVVVQGYEQFSIDMRPKEVLSGGICRVLITNEGNSEGEFRVVGRDPGEAIIFNMLFLASSWVPVWVEVLW
jgi:hypothetical protein